MCCSVLKLSVLVYWLLDPQPFSLHFCNKLVFTSICLWRMATRRSCSSLLYCVPGNFSTHSRAFWNWAFSSFNFWFTWFKSGESFSILQTHTHTQSVIIKKQQQKIVLTTDLINQPPFYLLGSVHFPSSLRLRITQLFVELLALYGMTKKKKKEEGCTEHLI